MKYTTATFDMTDAIYHILQTTIQTIYPKYYPKEVTDFFCRHHSKTHISDGIATGNMGVLMDGNTIVATGCFITTILQDYTYCLTIKNMDAAHRSWML